MITATATISSKRQITIPSIFFKDYDLKKGDVLVFKKETDGFRVKKAKDIIDRIAGSLKVPEHLKNVDLDEAIRRGAEEHFKKRACRGIS